jgi:hypothetical protein
MSARETAADVFSAIGAAGNVCLFLSQVPLMRRIIREGSSARYSWLPSLTLMTTLSLWSAYTWYALPQVQLFVANWTGMIIPAFYLVTFAVYAPTNAARVRIIGAGLLALAVTWGIGCGLFLGGASEPAKTLGGVTTASNITFFVSPLRQLYFAARELDIKRVPVLLSVVQVLQSTIWIIAGALLGDVFIVIVNSLGCGFALLQCSIVVYIVHARRRRGLGDAGPAAGADAGAESGKGVAGADSDSPSSARPSGKEPSGVESLAEQSQAALPAANPLANPVSPDGVQVVADGGAAGEAAASAPAAGAAAEPVGATAPEVV